MRKKKFKPGDRIPYAGRVYDNKEVAILIEAAREFWLTSGRFTVRFEKEFARFIGVKNCSLVNSGSSANLLAFMALTSPKLGEERIKPGDEVITVAAGFPTTIAPIIQYGAVPVFVDVTLPSYNIDCSQLEGAISEKTSAVMLAHTLGNPFNVKRVKEICDKHDLWLIEDNCIEEGRCSVLKIDGKIKVLTIKEIYDCFHQKKHRSFEILSHGEIIKENNLDAVSFEFMNYLSKRQLNILKLRKKLGHNSKTIAKALNISRQSYYCSLSEIRNKMNNQAIVKPRWSKVKNVLFKGRQKVRAITQNFGQTSVTGDHKLMFLEKHKLRDKCAENIQARKDTFVNIMLTENIEGTTMDLAEVLKGYGQANGRIKYDKRWVWFEYNNKCWRGRSPLLPKVKRFYRGKDLERLCALFGVYCAEGNCGHELRFASTDIRECRRVAQYIKKISNITAVRISRQDSRRETRLIRDKSFKAGRIVYSVNYGHELLCILFGELAGKGSWHKRVPNFVFDLDRKYMKIFYDYLIKGDGCRKSGDEIDFVITTASLKLASGINLLNNLIYRRFSRFIIARGKYYDIAPVKSFKQIKKKAHEIGKLRKKVDVYDIVVEGTSTFIDACGNVLLHNCDSLGSKYKLNGKWGYTGTFGDIGTSSFYPPHHMSCSSDTPIPYLDENGGWQLDTIEDIHDRYAKTPKKIRVISFDGDNKVEWTAPSAILRHKIGHKKMVKITCQHGREVKVTEDHSVFVLDEHSAKIVPKPAKNISMDDYIVATNAIPAPAMIEHIDTLDCFKSKNAYVSGFSRSNLKYVRNSDYRWQFKSRQSLPIKHLKDYDLAKDKIKVGILQSKKIPARIPLNNELCRLIGYFIAEGSYQNGLVFSFNKNEKNLIMDVEHIAKSLFDLRASLTAAGENAVNVEINSKNLEIVFRDILGIASGALNKRIPWFLFHARPEHIASFIYGYTRGDGSARSREGNTNHIDVTSASKKLINDFQYLLSRIGISASFYVRNKEGERRIGKAKIIGKENYTLCFSGYGYKGETVVKRNLRDRNNIAMHIPLLDVFRKYISVSKNQKVIARSKLKRYLEKGSELFKLVTSDLSFLRVRAIENIDSDADEYVYDFSVPGKENFYGGFLGVFLHNTMGEGGAVYTDDPGLNKIVNSLRDWGRDCWCPSGKDNTCNKRFTQQFGELPYGYDHKYVYSHFGYNLKATDLQAAIGCAQLEKLPAFIKARKKNWQMLMEGLADLSDVFILPEPAENSDPSWFGFLLTGIENSGLTRDKIVEHLEAAGIQTRMLFAGNMIKHPCFDEMRKAKKGYRVIGELKNTDLIMKNTFWVGVYPGLTEKMLEYMVETIKGAVNGRR